MWEEYNPNPMSRNVGDCSIRAVAKALDIPWEKAYILIAINGYAMCDMPSSDSVWGSVLRPYPASFRAIIPQRISARTIRRESTSLLSEDTSLRSRMGSFMIPGIHRMKFLSSIGIKRRIARGDI